MRAVGIIGSEEGFTLVELLAALGIAAIAAALIFSVYLQINRYFAAAALKTEFRQAVQVVKSVLEAKARYASRVEIVDSAGGSALPNRLYLDNGSRIAYAADGQKQILAGDGDLDFHIRFENRDPMLFFHITAADSKGDDYVFEMQILLLEAEMYGDAGSALYFVIN